MDASTPGNTENEPPEKETPKRLPGPLTTQEADSPSPTEGPTSKKRRRHVREEKEARLRRATPALLPMEEFPTQVLGNTSPFMGGGMALASQMMFQECLLMLWQPATESDFCVV